MRKIAFFITLCILLVSLSGCSSLNQVEKLAFAEVMGIDINDHGEIEVCIEVAKITGQQSDGGSSNSDSPLIYSASGKNIDEALSMLQWSVPRRLDLSQMKLIVVSEALAQDSQFKSAASTIMATPRLYTAARLAVSKGSAKEFIAAEKPVIGTRLSTELTATFDDYILNGYIPDTNFADFYLRNQSVYSDTLVTYAETSKAPVASPTDAEQAKPASAILPEESMLDKTETQHSNRYLGAAVFHQGKMIGKLSSEEFLYCKILSGGKQAFPYSIDHQTVGLTTLGSPSITMNLNSDPIQIDIALRFSIVSSSRSVQIPRLEDALKKSVLRSIDTCRKLKSEPFDFAEIAARHFLTVADWEAFDWNSQFLKSDIHVNVKVHDSKS